ncbi:MAG: hypothetical protein AAB454_00785, partial [Patescibacteria group bacterium]
ISPKDILSLTIKNAEKIVITKQKTFEQVNKNLEIQRTEYNKTKQALYNILITALTTDKSFTRDVGIELSAVLDNWLNNPTTDSIPYTVFGGRAVSVTYGVKPIALIVFKESDMDELKRFKDEDGRKDKENNAVFQWQKLVSQTQIKVGEAQKNLEDSEKELTNYRKELQALNLPSLPKEF